MSKRALFVTFEGSEGVGKSTQIRATESHFFQRGLKVFQTREPGGSPLSDAIRGVLLKSSSGLTIDPISELLLLEAARRQHVVDVLRQALMHHDLLLCDRFYDSTLAYQGGGRGLEEAFIRTLNERVTEGLTPDLTILLDMPEEVALKRAIKRIKKTERSNAEDRFEREAKEFHHRVRETYLGLARAEPSRFFLVDASADQKTITQTIVAEIERRLASSKPYGR